MRRTLIALAIAGLVVASLAQPAGAHRVRKFDGDDSASPLDLGRASFKHGRFVVVSATVRRGWASSLLASDDPATERDDSHLEWQIDTERDYTSSSYADYIVVFDHRNGRLKGQLLRWVRPYDTPGARRRPLDAKVTVWREGRTAFAKVRRSALHPDKKDWGWMAASIYKGPPPCDGQYGCSDEVLNNGFLFHHRVP